MTKPDHLRVDVAVDAHEAGLLEGLGFDAPLR